MTKVPKIRRNKGQRGKENKEIGCVKLELGLEKNVCAFRNHVQLSILRYYYSVNLGPIYFFFLYFFFPPLAFLCVRISLSSTVVALFVSSSPMMF